jgi:hypothetical protein
LGKPLNGLNLSYRTNLIKILKTKDLRLLKSFVISIPLVVKLLLYLETLINFRRLKDNLEGLSSKDLLADTLLNLNI